MTITASEMGKKGGKASVKKRFKGLSKKEISKKMSDVRKKANKQDEENLIKWLEDAEQI